jgi:hypothetical protein
MILSVNGDKTFEEDYVGILPIVRYYFLFEVRTGFLDVI